ncbi:MAG: permease-like cell division protein FtsX, partial [Myxococcota bacterium]|nr:permease-like cell division protein FtsX [Myxococcota bacterium]
MSGMLSIPRLSLFFREAWKNVRSAPVLSLVAVLTIAVSLILVGLFGFVMINADRVLDGMARDLRVTVYLTDDITSSEIDALQRRIADRDEVASITFLSAKDDRALNQALLTPALLDGLDEEAIPGQPALEVQIAPRQRTKEDFDSLMSWLRELKEVDTVQDTYFDADKIRILFAVMDLVRVTGT